MKAKNSEDLKVYFVKDLEGAPDDVWDKLFETVDADGAVIIETEEGKQLVLVSLADDAPEFSLLKLSGKTP